MKVKVSEASGPVLDWLVAKCLGYTHYEHDPIDGKVFRKTPKGFTADFRIEDNSFCYDWAQGGPIIEREGICFASIRKGRKIAGWRAAYRKDGVFGFDSSTTLIAACRCFVTSKLGDEVEVPDELI